MGSFSWNKADNLTKVENIVYGHSFKFLIPKEFGGGYIKDKYQDYGYLGTKENGEPKYDMYELLAFWNNADGLKYDGNYPKMKEIDGYTDHNRNRGIDIGCYDEEILKLKYPLKMVSPSFKGTYEDLKTCSLSDPDQGFFARKRKHTTKSEEVKPEPKKVNRFDDYMTASKELLFKLFGKELIEKLNGVELKPVEWNGLDITETSITAGFPNVKERFSEDWIEYFKERNHTALDMFLQTVFHYGYQQAVDNEVKKQPDIAQIIKLLETK